MSDELEREVEGLRRLSRQQLKDRWRALFKAAPPVRRLLAGGGNGASLRRRSAARATLRPGNRLVRRWRGRTYLVEVTEGGLVYDGTTFSSLSIIATKITGTRWSGPKFFGLVG